MNAESFRAEWRVRVTDDEHVSAVYEAATSPGALVTFVCAHGAGGHMADRGLVRTAETMRGHGFNVVRFNFVYRERQSGRPDPMPLLKTCVAAVVARVRDEVSPRLLIIGGRSMGGRAASMLAAEGFACDGLLLLAYPLHPAGKPEQLRDAHLASIAVPALCLNGTRDPLCTRALMERVLERLPASFTMHWLDGADHSFHVLKSSGRTDAEILEEIGATSEAWALRSFGPARAEGH